ncbi:Protein phosphatase methylesterase 1 [Candida viswanathii]|uniref:Protein phosphatase methylesterase 1 n=1 Tax=Candida viswanathii TaxID=5486 RepID=A0A367YL79_9ASCO|nr:Protein phosphatase methylesterase 1 [Candida viswanathii]
MSNLHKTFLKRIREQESALGLSELGAPEPAVHPTNSVPKKSNPKDSQILEKYNEFKHTQFTEEFYETDLGDKFKTYYKPATIPDGAVIVGLHGAGSSSMTFANLVNHIKDESLSIFLFDIRGHGGSTTTTDDFSLDTMVKDTQFVLTKFISKYNPSSLFLLGHSLGGSIFSKFVNVYPDDKYKGLILLDIVEEAAVQSLNAMPQFIERRPKSFDSISRAILWHMNFLLFNEKSAELSVPDLFTDDLTWKTDLLVTQPYWSSWFAGLSENFLSFKGAKLLILSTHETLDKKLMIGQMQGKYQLVVFKNNEKSGHFVHEDLPNHVAVCLTDYIKRAIAPEKFMKEDLGIVPKWGGKIHK